MKMKKMRREWNIRRNRRRKTRRKRRRRRKKRRRGGREGRRGKEEGEEEGEDGGTLEEGRRGGVEEEEERRTRIKKSSPLRQTWVGSVSDFIFASAYESGCTWPAAFSRRLIFLLPIMQGRMVPL